MRLSKRLQTISSMINTDGKIYDVGCDHAYLDIYMAGLGYNCVAIDVRNSVIENAKKNVAQSGFQNKIEVVLNDGLEDITIDENSIVVLSGLGTRTILKIIDDKRIKQIIIQSNDDLYLLRKTMMERGYSIINEKIIFEDNKYYVIINFEIGYVTYSDTELLLGPILLQNKDKIFINYLKTKFEHLNRVLSKVPEQYNYRKKQIEKTIEQIKTALN